MSSIDNTISLFEEMSQAIATKYLAEVKIMTAAKGERPGFDELMAILKKFEKELTQIGAQTVDTAKKVNNPEIETLTDKLHTIIKSTVEGFIKQL
ncbi:MAG: hypothetical protein H6551_08175 [Chitinophagales bacterium]|nr:hypothetical protein [Chitinophagaceae bacterium]MCB9065099.1 hypothetical protein [Chitinophagales bacterium]